MTHLRTLDDAEAHLFLAAEAFRNICVLVNRYADEAGFPSLNYGMTKTLTREQDGAYGDAEVGGLKILTALYGEEVAERLWHASVDCGESLAHCRPYVAQDIY